MSDEIKKMQEEAQRIAKEHGIYEIVHNVASNGKRTKDFCEVEWEGCKVKFKEPRKAAGILPVAEVAEIFGARASIAPVTSIIMPDGTVLYRSFGDNRVVTVFRYGAWVERMKAYSEQITLERRQIAEAKAQKKQEDRKSTRLNSSHT